MKIEKINDNQIKCTLTRSDLASRQIRLSELTYGTEKARGLFQDMMEQANMELGFDISDFPLMIEAIPVSMDCIVLMITKVDDPEDVDPEVSELTTYDDIYAEDSRDDFDFSSIFSSLAAAGIGESITPALAPKHPAAHDDLYIIYSFDTLEAVINLARSVSGIAEMKNSLYRSYEDEKFYLVAESAPDKRSDMSIIFSRIQEFGSREPSGYSRAAYINEHFEKLLGDDALQSLAYV